jgi:branched-chain amino acid transport system permease protein
MKLTWNLGGLAAVAVIGVAVLVALPMVADLFVLMQLTLYLAFGILALSLGFVWGYGGIFSFGQATFFGLGGYTYAVVAFNMGDSTVPLIAAVAVPTAFAFLLGYFMFYGRISTVYLAIITLTVSLIFYKFMGHTAGYQYTIGSAHLGGFNGMPSIPPINLPGYPQRMAYPEDMFVITGAALLLIYFGLRALLASRFGRVVVAIRENESRAEMLGYDTRLYKMVTFGIGGGIAGVSGIMFANWNAYISPTVFELAFSAQILIWVVVGGLGTLIGPVLGAIALGYISIELGARSIADVNLDVNLVLGAILLIFVLAVPQGLQPTARYLAQRYLPWTRPPPEAEEAPRAREGVGNG